jgi:hypothetical protein
MLKSEDKEISQQLCKILQHIWDSETTQEEWKTGLIIKLHTKVDLSICDNMRGIILIPLSNLVAKFSAELY